MVARQCSRISRLLASREPKTATMASGVGARAKHRRSTTTSGLLATRARTLGDRA